MVSLNVRFTQVLPDLAKQFYEAWATGDVSAHVDGRLRQPNQPQARLLKELMQRHADVAIEDLHVCTKTSKVVVELQSGGCESTKAMHSLTFTEDGLVSSFVPYGLVEVTSAAGVAAC